MRGLRLALTLLLLVPTLAVAQNCCMPKLGEEEEAQRLVDGIQWATGVLLVPPVALVTFGVYRFCRVPPPRQERQVDSPPG